MLDDHLTYKMAGNKPLILKLLQEQNVPMPQFREFTAKRLQTAEAFLSNSATPVVVKPADGTAAGHGITTGVSNKKDLRRATVVAAMLAKQFLVEEEVPGDSYRLLYLNGELIDAIRRDRPAVVGDGRLSISKLIEQENLKREQSESPRSLHPLTIDLDLELRLKRDNRSLAQVPHDGEHVVVKNVCNQNSKHDQHVVRDDVHPDTVALGGNLVSHLGVELAGVDVHCRDIGEPLAETGGVIGEINTTPGLHHHVLVSDSNSAAPVGARILERLLGAGDTR